MKNQKTTNIEKDKLLQLLKLQDSDHASILSGYKKHQEALQDQMETSTNIRERIRFQNLMIALDDAFLDYQSSLRN